MHNATIHRPIDITAMLNENLYIHLWNDRIRCDPTVIEYKIMFLNRLAIIRINIVWLICWKPTYAIDALSSFINPLLIVFIFLSSSVSAAFIYVYRLHLTIQDHLHVDLIDFVVVVIVWPMKPMLCSFSFSNLSTIILWREILIFALHIIIFFLIYNTWKDLPRIG